VIFLREVFGRPNAFEWVACSHNLSQERKPQPMLRSALRLIVGTLAVAALFVVAWGLFK